MEINEVIYNNSWLKIIDKFLDLCIIIPVVPYVQFNANELRSKYHKKGRNHYENQHTNNGGDNTFHVLSYNSRRSGASQSKSS